MTITRSNSSTPSPSITSNHTKKDDYIEQINMPTSSIVDICKECHDLVTDFISSSTPYTATLNSRNYKTVSPFPTFHQNLKLHQSTQSEVINSLNIYKELLTKYSLNELSISYNGGKDCLVMLIIYLAAIYSHFQSRNNLVELKSHSLNSVYINNETTFEEQDDFLLQSSIKYQLSLLKIKDRMKSGFSKYLSLKPEIKAIVVGIRRIDPFGKDLSYLQKTDHGWPLFMRVNPVLEFTYSQVWYFLKACNVEYCHLYDKGYTSIGGIDNTIPNPLLKVTNGDAKDGVEYLPAYMLDDDNHERLSRVSDGLRDSGGELLVENGNTRQQRGDEKL